jgi:EmrB/QacA subfamily drug resistance transporter
MTTSAAAARAGHPGPIPPGSSRRWLALVLLCLAQFMLILDVTVVNVALPAIGAALHLDRPALTWTLTAYTLVLGGLMLLGGRLADMSGARRTLLGGLAVFTAASALSGLAVNAAMLVGGRVAQGAGAALMSPSALSLVTTTFTGAERNRALGAWAAVGGAGSAIGVLLGGVLTSAAGWRWIFFINVPVGLLVIAVLPALVAGGRPAHGTAHGPVDGAAGRRQAGGRGRLDVPGALLVTAATGAAIYGLISAGSHGWLSAQVLAPLGAAGILYAAFGAAERRMRTPLVDLRLLTRRGLAAGAPLMLLATGLLVGTFFLGSFYLQRHAGYSALRTGLSFLPVAVATGAGAHAASRVITRLDSRLIISCSLGLAALGAAVAARWTGAIPLLTGMSLSALGLGATLVAVFTTALARVDGRAAGVVSGIVNTFHELGSAVGVAVVSSLAAASLGTAAPGLGGFTRAFAVLAAVAVAAAVLAALIVPAGKPPRPAVRPVH